MTQAQEFAVGDRVQINAGLGSSHNGKCGVITEMLADGTIGDIKLDDGDSTYGYPPEMLRLIRRAQPEASGDKLCDACGGNACRGSSGSKHAYYPGLGNNGDVSLCAEHWDTGRYLDREIKDLIIRRRSQPAPVAESWHGFAKGERVKTCNNGRTGVVTGAQGGYLLVKCDDGFIGGGPNGEIGQIPRNLTRLGPAPTPESPRFYGTMPSKLPGTLPAGVAIPGGDWKSGEGCRFDGTYYRGFRSKSMPSWGDGGFLPSSIDWSTVPIQPDAQPAEAKEAAPGDRRCPTCLGHPDDGIVHEPNSADCLAQKMRFEFFADERAKSEERQRRERAYRNKGFVPFDARVGLQSVGADRKAQALAQLSKPIRTGALKNRDRYGQLLSARGWPEDSEHEGMV